MDGVGKALYFWRFLLQLTAWLQKETKMTRYMAAQLRLLLFFLSYGSLVPGRLTS